MELIFGGGRGGYSVQLICWRNISPLFVSSTRESASQSDFYVRHESLLSFLLAESETEMYDSLLNGQHNFEASICG
jgi:hypothetical protein